MIVSRNDSKSCSTPRPRRVNITPTNWPLTPIWSTTPGSMQALPNKSQTYSVEGDNSDLRHYLARLARKSRCFTRSLRALRDAVKLFVYAWNRRQLYRRKHPKYAAHVFQFAYS